MSTKLRKQLIDAGVKNLREFGYPSCNADQILTDPIFSAFFESMLKDNLGNGEQYDREINALLNDIAANRLKA
jgi:hypothetical protein